MRTAPARLPSTRAVAGPSRPTTTRSRTASACSRGNCPISVSACSVESVSRAAAAVSWPLGSSRTSCSRNAVRGRRFCLRRWSSARCRAIVAVQPRTRPRLRGTARDRGRSPARRRRPRPHRPHRPDPVHSRAVRDGPSGTPPRRLPRPPAGPAPPQRRVLRRPLARGAVPRPWSHFPLRTDCVRRAPPRHRSRCPCPPGSRASRLLLRDGAQKCHSKRLRNAGCTDRACRRRGGHEPQPGGRTRCMEASRARQVM